MATDRCREATFQELIDEGSLEIGDGYRAKNNELGGTGPIFLRAGHVSDTHIDFSGVEQFHEKLRNRLAQKFAMAGDTIITTKGNSTGRTSFVTERMPEFVYSPHLSYWRSRNPRVICGGFLRYWSRGSQFRSQLRGMSASTDMAPYLSLTDQRRLRITLPPVTRQERIADILGTLDDKIELNRCMNKTLEAMARRLFRSWFIDFDPVHAKAVLRRERPKLSNADLSRRALPNMAPDIAELFPDSFENSTLGPIPKGWKVGPLLGTAELVSGGTPRTSEPRFWGGRIPWASAKDVSQCGETFLIRTDRTITEAGLRNSSTKLIDAFATVVVARGATTGRMAMFGHNIAMNQTCYALRSRRECPFHLYCDARHVIDALVRSAHGSVFDTITTRTFETSAVVIAPDLLVKGFERLLVPLFRAILATQHETLTLSRIRDRLLPRLLSGELDVNGAHKLPAATT